MAEKLPYIAFFPSDWLSDEKLRLCSVAARGLWIDLLCLMHRCDRRGFLEQANGKPFTQAQIAKFAGCTSEEVGNLLQELIDSGAASVSDGKIIYSRRMIKEEHIRQVRSKAGSKGGKKRRMDLLKQNQSKPSSKMEANSRMEWNGIGIPSSEEEGIGGKEDSGTGTDPPDFENSAPGCSRSWLHFYRGNLRADRDLDQITPLMEELHRQGHSYESINARICDKTRKRQEPAWQFAKWFEPKQPNQRLGPDEFAEELRRAQKERDRCKASRNGQ